MDINYIKKRYWSLAKLAWENKLDTTTQKEIIKEFKKVTDEDKITLVNLMAELRIKEVTSVLLIVHRLWQIDKKHSGIYLNFFATVITNHPECVPQVASLFKQKGKLFWEKIIIPHIKHRDEKLYDKYLRDIK